MNAIDPLQKTWTDFPPILARPTEAYVFENSTRYDVAAAVDAITQDPDSFRFILFDPNALSPQLDVPGNFDPVEMFNLSEEDMMRPLLITTQPNGHSRLIDGYHRGARCRFEGIPLVGAWLLNVSQTARITTIL